MALVEAISLKHIGTHKVSVFKNKSLQVFYGHFMCVYCFGVLLGELLLVHEYVFGCCQVGGKGHKAEMEKAIKIAQMP